MLHQVGVLFDLYYDARKHKIKIYDRSFISSIDFSKRLNLKTSTKSLRLQNDRVRNTDGSKPEVYRRLIL